MNKFTRTRRIIGVALFIFVSVAIILSVYVFQSIGLFYITTPPSVLSVLNLKEGVLSIDSNSEDLTLNIFDSFIKESFDENIKIIDNDNILKEVKLDNSPESHLNVYINAAQSYCFFSADVTPIYYQTESEEVVTETLPSESNFVQVPLNYKEYIYIYPGRYAADLLPQVLAGRHIKGIYSIDCSLIENYEAKINIVKLFKDFDSEEQRNYYFEEIKKLQDS